MEWFVKNISLVGGLASIAGIVFGIPAFVLALVQLHRTKKAAEAAEKSANETLKRVSGVVAVASIEQICSRSRDLLHLTRARDLSGSATAAFELREAIAKFSKSKGATQLQEESVWLHLLDGVGAIHDALEGAAAIKKIDAGHREELLLEIAKIHSQLSMLAGVAGEKAGEDNAYSKRLS